MPSYTTYPTNNLLPTFPPAVTEADIKTSSAVCDPSFVTSNLISLASYLVDIVNHTNVFGPASNDTYQPSLATLYARLIAGRSSLTPLPALAKDTTRLRSTLSVRIDTDISERPLEDLEDLYYAALARMQEMLHTLNMRITSGFNNPTDTLFPSGPSITAWHASLTEYWSILNEAVCGRALDDAVRRSRINHLYEEIQARLERNEISHETAGVFFEELFGVRESTEGMMFVADWNPVVVGVRLAEKYRVLFKVEREEGERRKRERRRKAKMPGVDVRVRKRRSGEGRKRVSIGEMVEGMQEGLLGLRDGGGAVKDTNVGGKAVEGMRAETEHVDKNTRIEDDRYAHDIAHQDHRPTTEWHAKSQRVSDYAAYLRNQASHDARSIVTSSVYNPSLDGSTLRSPYEAFAMNEDTDTMES